VNYRVPRSRVGGSQNVRNLLLDPKWTPVANVRLGKGSVKTIWRGSARCAPGEALLATPQQLELTVIIRCHALGEGLLETTRSSS